MNIEMRYEVERQKRRKREGKVTRECMYSLLYIEREKEKERYKERERKGEI